MHPYDGRILYIPPLPRSNQYEKNFWKLSNEITIPARHNGIFLEGFANSIYNNGDLGTPSTPAIHQMGPFTGILWTGPSGVNSRMFTNYGKYTKISNIYLRGVNSVNDGPGSRCNLGIFTLDNDSDGFGTGHLRLSYGTWI